MEFPIDLDPQAHDPSLKEAVANQASLQLRKSQLMAILSRPARGSNRGNTQSMVKGLEESGVNGGVQAADDANAISYEEREKYDRELRDILSAIDLQERVIVSLRARATKEICEKLWPMYREMVRDIAKAIPAFDRLVAREHEFRRLVTDAGLDSFGSYIPPAALRESAFIFDRGNGTNSGDFNRFFRDAREGGYLNDADLMKLGVYELFSHLTFPTPPLVTRAAVATGV